MNIIISQVSQIRKVTIYLLEPLFDQDWFVDFTLADKPINNLAWQIGHIAVSENFLLNHALGLPSIKIPWARQFGLGSQNAMRDSSPDITELWSVFNEVHDNTIKNLSTLDNANLDQIISVNFMPPPFSSPLTYLQCITHGIWHESYHDGQIALLYKGYGIKGV